MMGNIRNLVWLAGLIILLGAAPAPAQPTADNAPRGEEEINLVFAPRVEVGAQPVTLLDMIEPGQTIPDALRDQLGSLTVSTPPSLGRTQLVHHSKVRGLLRQAGLADSLELTLPDSVMLTRASMRLSGQQLTQLYLNAVNERLGERAAQADIHHVEAVRDLLLPAGQLTTQVRLLSSHLLGRLPAVIDVMVDGVRETQVRITGTVDIYSEVVVAARPLMAGHVLSAQDLVVAKANLNEVGAGIVFHPAEVIGMRTRSVVPLGGALDLNRLERPPVIRLGDVVVMVYDTGGIRVSAKGRAEQTGYLGGRIRLTNMASRREVWGKVLDSGQVLVD